MADALNILLQIGVILFGGTFLSFLGRRLRIPEILLFILFGIGLQQFSKNVYPFLDLPFIFMATTGLLVLALTVFEGSAHIRFQTLDRVSTTALKMIALGTIFHMTLFTTLVWLMTQTPWPQAALFAAILAGTSAPVVLVLLEKTKGYVLDLLRLESLLNTPLNAILPFLVIDLLFYGANNHLLSQVKPLLLKLSIGIGVGVLAGLILFKVLRLVYSRVYAPLAVLIASLITYALSEVLGGNGVLGVMALGLLFGNLYIKQRGHLLEVESVFSRSVYILLFVLFGTLLSLPVSWQFFLVVVVLLFGYVLLRYVGVALSVRHLLRREKWYIALVGPNGVTAISITFVLVGLNIPGMEKIVELV
ncbi:cation:proton antiporter, partial [Candidatus Woesearchaeota archaeon]|nr:cation:proton antiporter [Candidatus Woesearchaeota archaeon]